MRISTPNDADFLEGIPSVLYKYRNWDIDFHKNLVLKGEVYFSSFDQLNDPFEGSIPFRYKKEQLTIENLYLKFVSFMKTTKPDVTSEEIDQEWKEQLKVKKWEDDNHRLKNEEKFTRQLHEVYGVFCLCEKNDNYLLWSYYANAHKGFCVGLNSKNLVVETVSSIAPVAYSDTIPRIDIFEHPSLAFRKLTETKAIFWQHENEYRLKNIKFRQSSCTVTPATIQEIIFGEKMSQDLKFQIMEQSLAFNKGVRFYQANRNLDEFKLDIREIS